MACFPLLCGVFFDQRSGKGGNVIERTLEVKCLIGGGMKKVVERRNW